MQNQALKSNNGQYVGKHKSNMAAGATPAAIMNFTKNAINWSNIIRFFKHLVHTCRMKALYILDILVREKSIKFNTPEYSGVLCVYLTVFLLHYVGVLQMNYSTTTVLPTYIPVCVCQP